jgi:hypothetical protein
MDISLRYRRTVIGPLWITLTLAATIASVGTVYAALFKQDVTSFSAALRRRPDRLDPDCDDASGTLKHLRGVGPSDQGGAGTDLLEDAADRELVPDYVVVIRCGFAADDVPAHGEIVGHRPAKSRRRRLRKNEARTCISELLRNWHFRTVLQGGPTAVA